MATRVEQELGPGPPAPVPMVRDGLSLWRVVGWLAPLVIAFAVYLAVYDAMNPGTTGDEPHYLLVAESIAFDGDVDMRNDYASRERTLRVVNVFPLDYNVQAAVYKDSGELRPLHGVGLSALLAPAVGLGGLTGARVVMVLIAALLAHQLYFLLKDLGLRRRYRIAAWIAVAFCMPVVPFTSQIYPELPGALIVVVVLRIILRRTVSPWVLAMGSLATSALFWLHVRYFPISFALLAGLAYAATSDPTTRTADPPKRGLRERARIVAADLQRHFVAARKRWRTTTVPVLVPYALVLVSFVLAFQHWYGSPDPRTPYYAYSSTTLGGGGLRAVYDYGLHDLFNPLVGWIPFAPVHWLGLAALGCVVVWFGWPAAAVIAVAAAYELILASSAPVGGWGLPARYLLIVIPLIAVPIAVVIQQLRLARAVFVVLLVGSLVLTVAAVRDFEGLYPAGERQRIFGLRSIAPAFPVTLPPLPPTSFALSPGQARTQTGRVQGQQVVARQGRDKPGFMLWGPYSPLKTGAYEATFSLSAAGARPDALIAVIEVIGGADVVFAREGVMGNQLQPGRLTEIDLSFATPGEMAVQTRVFYMGRGTLRSGPVVVQRVAPEGGPAARLRDWPLAFLWVGGTVLIGALFVQLMKLGGRRAV
jgi:hypothetical protein